MFCYRCRCFDFLFRFALIFSPVLCPLESGFVGMRAAVLAWIASLGTLGTSGSSRDEPRRSLRRLPECRTVYGMLRYGVDQRT